MGGERRHVAFLFHAPQGLARIRGHEPRNILRRRQRRGVKHHALEEVDKSVVLPCTDSPRMAGRRPKGRLVWREPIVFELDRFALGILTDDHEVTKVRDKNLTVRFPVFRDLGAIGRQERVVTGGLGLYDSARRFVPGNGSAAEAF
jgi:hypothetical protein